MAATSSGPLEGLRVLDITQMLAGPLACARLGDLGADVIKIEPPHGEFNRTHGFADARIDDEMSTFVALNRNKRSLCLDLKSDSGRSVLHCLVRDADVVVQNFRVGTAERLGLGYDDLAVINPGLVYCSITGYGSTGPYRDRPGQDLVVQGYSGSMYSVGAADDPPLPGAVWAADTMSGYQAVIGILAALRHRDLTGTGQRVDVDMFSVILDTQLQELVTYLNTGEEPTRSREWSAHASIPAPYGVYKTSDGWLTLAMSPLPKVGDVLDDDWLRTLTDYNDGSIHRDEVLAHLRHAFTDHTTEEWIQRCDTFGVWAGPVHDYQALENDPHVQETGMIVHQPGPAREIRTTRVPIGLSSTPPSIRLGAPELGEHSTAVLREYGYDDTAIADLVDNGAVIAGESPAGSTRTPASTTTPGGEHG